MKVCKNCKSVNQDGAMFCVKCNGDVFTVLSNQFPFESKPEFEESERIRIENKMTSQKCASTRGEGGTINANIQ